MVVQVAHDVDKRGVALSARVSPSVICQPAINDCAQWVINDSKIDSKKYFPFDRRNISNVATHPAGCPAGKIVLCLHRN